MEETMSQISAFVTAQAHLLLKGANICHSAFGISRSATKWIGGFSLLSLLFSVYKLMQLNKTHDSENHKSSMFTFECIDTSCQIKFDELRKAIRITKKLVLLCGSIYLASTVAKYLSSKLINHLNKVGQ